jgi:hypothetical protein
MPALLTRPDEKGTLLPKYLFEILTVITAARYYYSQPLKGTDGGDIFIL